MYLFRFINFEIVVYEKCKTSALSKYFIVHVSCLKKLTLIFFSKKNLTICMHAFIPTSLWRKFVFIFYESFPLMELFFFVTLWKCLCNFAIDALWFFVDLSESFAFSGCIIETNKSSPDIRVYSLARFWFLHHKVVQFCFVWIYWRCHFDDEKFASTYFSLADDVVTSQLYTGVLFEFLQIQMFHLTMYCILFKVECVKKSELFKAPHLIVHWANPVSSSIYLLLLFRIFL